MDGPPKGCMGKAGILSDIDVVLELSLRLRVSGIVAALRGGQSSLDIVAMVFSETEP